VKFTRYLDVSWLRMRARPVRASLSLLGIFIGVLSLVLILSIRNGIQRQMSELYRTSGARVLLVYPGFDPVTKRIGNITPQDLTFLKELPGILSVSRRENSEWTIGTPGRTERARVMGIDESFLSVYRVRLVKGRALLADEIARKSWVCLISQELEDKLFPFGKSIGSSVETAFGPFEVVGVVRWDETTAQRSGLNDIHMWVSPVWSQVGSTASPFITTLEVRFAESMDAQQASSLVRGVLTKGNPERDAMYFIQTMDQVVKRHQQFSDRIMSGLLGIALISLLVGGIGIANVMITSVTERTREVGIRKALGARRIDILMQFLVESMVLCGTGGLLAVFTGGLLSQVLPQILPQKVPMLFTLPPAIGCLALTLFVGLVAGVYPASRAADLQPAEALRYE